jgi:acetate---CoA ligase (ADP-forming)
VSRPPTLSLLEARSVAVVGASPRPGSFGHRVVTELSRSTAPIEIHLVNPRHQLIEERVCVPSLEALPGPVDLVLLAVPDSALEEEIGRAARRGDRSAVIFGSVVDPPPARSEPGGSAPPGMMRARVSALAGAAGMAVCGGGCMGFVNVAYGLRAIGYVEPDPIPPGPVALVTHSGSAFSALLRTNRRIGFTLAVSSGQELVTAAPAFIDYALDLPGTRVVALLLEALRDPLALRAALTRAAEADVAVVALTVGASAAGRELVAAHSGALAGDDGGWEALFEAYGVLRVRDLDEMADTLELLSAGRRAACTGAGGGIATVHDSGAERALVADIADEEGVPYAVISAATTAALNQLLDPGLEPGNPLDVWGTGARTREVFANSLAVLAADPAVAAVALSVDLVEELDGDQSYEEAAIDAYAATDKPVAVLSNLHSALDQRAAAHLRQAGIPVLAGSRSGLRSLNHLLELRDYRARPEVTPPPADAPRRARWLDRLAAGPLDAGESFALLGDYGIASMAAREVESAAEAVSAADSLGYPVVLKTDDPAISHKTEVGGVIVGLASAAAVAAAYEDIHRRLGRRALVAATAPAGVELALGIVRDPQLGPLVLVGAGGVLVELLADRAVALPPLDDERAGRLLERISSRRLLEGVRGSPAADLAAVRGALVALSLLAQELGEGLAALDVNPLSCGPRGALALDVLVVPAPKS